MKRYGFSDLLCFCVAVLCVLYAELFLGKIYYYPQTKFFMMLYQYFTYQIFWFCVMKLCGSLMQKRNLIKTKDKKRTKSAFVVFVLFYFIFVFLLEKVTVRFTLMLSPIRFFVYALFGAAGLLVGINNKN
ncbi:hypothetical protein [Anaerotignum faecicola]